MHRNAQMSYTLLKALHIIFVVTWFAGLFYMFRLFVYHREAQDQTPGPVRDALIAQFRIMERRLWFAITWPSSILAITFGVGMLYHIPGLPRAAVASRQAGICGAAPRVPSDRAPHLGHVAPRGCPWSSTTYRLPQRGAHHHSHCLGLLVVYKDTLSWLGGVGGILGVAVALTFAVRLYKKVRERNS